MMKRPTKKQVNWAHSVMNDRGHNAETKRRAAAVIAADEYDPFEQEDYRGDSFSEDDY